MAKRIKIKGKPPRGLSKAERIVRGADATFKGESRLVNKRRERENYKGELVGMPDRIADSHIETLAGLRDYANLSPEARRGQTKPSSTRKKRVKEGSRKFIGPRQLTSELREDRDARTRASDGNPVKYIEKERGPGRRGEIYELDEGGIFPFAATRSKMRKFKRLSKEGPSGQKRANAILARILGYYDDPLNRGRGGVELPF